MDNSKKERNSVDLFSDYGLDERQKSIAAQIAFSGFKTLTTLVIVISIFWFALCGANPELEIHFRFIAASYFAAAIACRMVYAYKSAKSGIINGITAFSYTTGSIIRAAAFAGIGLILLILGICKVQLVNLDFPFYGIMLLFASVEEMFLNYCGKLNFKTLDEQNKEEDEDNENNA